MVHGGLDGSGSGWFLLVEHSKDRLAQVSKELAERRNLRIGLRIDDGHPQGLKRLVFCGVQVVKPARRCRYRIELRSTFDNKYISGKQRFTRSGP